MRRKQGRGGTCGVGKVLSFLPSNGALKTKKNKITSWPWTAAVQNITTHQPTKNMRLRLIMVLRSGTIRVGHREGCYASFWQQLRGNILERIKKYIEFNNKFFSLPVYIFNRKLSTAPSANPSRRWYHEDIGSFATAMPLDPANGSTMVVRVLDVRRVFFSSNSTIPTYKIARYHRIVSFYAAKYKNSKNKMLRVLQNRDLRLKGLARKLTHWLSNRGHDAPSTSPLLMRSPSPSSVMLLDGKDAGGRKGGGQ